MDDSQDLELKRPGRVEKEDPQEGILLWQGSVFPKCGSGPPKPECSTHQPLMIEYSPDLPKAHSSMECGAESGSEDLTMPKTPESKRTIQENGVVFRHL